MRRLPPHIVSRFFEFMTELLAAKDERQIRSLEARRYEKVPSECKDCYSLRPNDQFRVIVTPVTDPASGETAMVVRDVRDYQESIMDSEQIPYVKREPARVIPPGATFRNELEYRGISQRQFARIIARPPQFVSELVNAALRLEAALDVPADF